MTSARQVALVAVLGTGCAAVVDPGPRPADFDGLDLAHEIPQAELLAIADALQPCMGGPYDLDGWRAWTVARVVDCEAGAECFSCPIGVAGCPEGAECLCGGVSDVFGKRIAVAPDRASLVHEVQHAAWGLRMVLDCGGDALRCVP